MNLAKIVKVGFSFALVAALSACAHKPSDHGGHDAAKKCCGTDKCCTTDGAKCGKDGAKCGKADCGDCGAKAACCSPAGSGGCCKK